MSRDRTIAFIGATALVVAVLVAGEGTAYAKGVEGCTTMQMSTATVCAKVDATSPNSINSFGGSFFSGTKVVRPRLVAYLVMENGEVGMTASQEWQNDRTAESIEKRVNQSLGDGNNRACAALYEAGEKLATACSVGQRLIIEPFAHAHWRWHTDNCPCASANRCVRAGLSFPS